MGWMERGRKESTDEKHDKQRQSNSIAKFFNYFYLEIKSTPELQNGRSLLFESYDKLCQTSFQNEYSIFMLSSP